MTDVHEEHEDPAAPRAHAQLHRPRVAASSLASPSGRPLWGEAASLV